MPRNRANLAWDLRDTDPLASCEAAEVARRAARAEADDAAHHRALAALGYARFSLGEPDEAESILTEATAAGDRTGDRLGLARTLLAVAVLRSWQGLYGEAVQRLREAGDLFREQGDEDGVAAAAMHLALASKRLGDRGPALGLLLATEQHFHASDNARLEAVALKHRVDLTRELGDLQAALPLARRLVALADRLGSPAFAAEAQGALASVLAMSGAQEASIAAAEAAVAFAVSSLLPQITADSLATLGGMFVDTDPRRADELIDRATRALTAGTDPRTVVVAQIALAEAHARAGKAAWARELSEAAAALAGGHGVHAAACRAHQLAAQACTALGDEPAALRWWRAAHTAQKAIEAERQASGLLLPAVTEAIAHFRTEADRFAGRVAEVVAAERLWADLIGVFVHDLRSPLTAALLSSDLLAERATTRTDAMLADDLGAALEGIRRILDALSDDATAVGTAREPTPAEEDLLGLSRALASAHTARSGTKGVRVTVDGGPARARIDLGRFAQALDKLLSNAVTTARPGEAVRVRLVEQPTTVRIEVEGVGPSLEPAELHRLFRPFGATTQATGARPPGLGLYVARRLVECLGGTMGADPANPRATLWFEVSKA